MKRRRSKMGNLVQFDKNDRGIGVVTLSRPEAANALSKQLLTELQNVLTEIRSARDVRVVIITGSGEKAFCAGADLKERKKIKDHQQIKDAVSLIRTVVNSVEA